MMRLVSLFLGLALVSLSLPARAGSHWVRAVDVCTDANEMVLDDVGGNGPSPGDGFTAFGWVFPLGTLGDGDLPCTDRGALGPFYATGRFLMAGPMDDPDLAYAAWHIEFDGKGAIETKGVVKLSPHSHAVIGRTGYVRSGRVARVRVLGGDPNFLRIYFRNY